MWGSFLTTHFGAAEKRSSLWRFRQRASPALENLHEIHRDSELARERDHIDRLVTTQQQLADYVAIFFNASTHTQPHIRGTETANKSPIPDERSALSELAPVRLSSRLAGVR